MATERKIRLDDVSREQILGETFLPEVVSCAQRALSLLSHDRPDLLSPDNLKLVSKEELRRISSRNLFAKNPLYLAVRDSGANREIMRQFFPKPEPSQLVYADSSSHQNQIFLNKEEIQKNFAKDSLNLGNAHVIGIHLIYVQLALSPHQAITYDPNIYGMAKVWIKNLFEELYGKEESFREPEQLVAAQDLIEEIVNDPKRFELSLFGVGVFGFIKEKSGLRLLFIMNPKMNFYIAKLLQHGLVDEFMGQFDEQFFKNLSRENRKRQRENIEKLYQSYLEDQAAEEGIQSFVAKRELARQFLQKLGFNKPRDMFRAYVESQILPVYFERLPSKPELKDIYKQLTS